jgi:DNA-binding winged helix-turn-helix (wHTH) protein/TolB-like protein
MREWFAAMRNGRFRFGLFEFDGGACELRREGVLVHLQSQPAQVLACLIERANQVVSRDDLRKAVWGDGTFVDFDGGLNFCISQIRSALQDNSAQPLFIRTVPKSGYQFIAPVQCISAQPPGASQVGAAQREPSAARGIALILAAAALVVVAFFSYRFRSVHSASRAPILAVLRFDNESGDPGVTKFSDALTDNVVEQLASLGGGNYRVIGNAQILRSPREERDLKAIASSLHAAYVVLGQVQTKETQVRILAHLIRLSDQTHIWVVRIDGSLTDPLSLESEAAGKIAAEFSARMSADPRRAASFPSASR